MKNIALVLLLVLSCNNIALSQEAYSANQSETSLKENTHAQRVYKIQLGCYRNFDRSVHIDTYYNSVSNIGRIHAYTTSDGFVKILLGDFYSYEKAKEKLKEVQEKFNDAFVLEMRVERKITVLPSDGVLGGDIVIRLLVENVDSSIKQDDKEEMEEFTNNAEMDSTYYIQLCRNNKYIPKLEVFNDALDILGGNYYNIRTIQDSTTLDERFLVGEFSTKAEAIIYCKKLSSNYPGCFVCKEKKEMVSQEKKLSDNRLVR